MFRSGNRFRGIPAALAALIATLALSGTATATADTTAPTVGRPMQSMALGAQLGSATIPVSLIWSGADTGGSGVQGYVLERSTDGGQFEQITLPHQLATSVVVQLLPNHTYQFRVSATDNAGNHSGFAYGRPFVTAASQEKASTISYTGTWSHTASSLGSMGWTMRSGERGATAQFKFTGSSVAWVASGGPGGGQAQVYIDGVYVRTVDLYRNVTTPRQVFFTHDFRGSAQHTLTLKVMGTAGRPAVDVDAFAVLR